MTDPPRHDWPAIIGQIKKKYSVYKIALMMHRQYTQVRRWELGLKIPLHHEGEMLLAILEDVKKESSYTT